MIKVFTYIYFLIITYLFLIPGGVTPPPFWGFDKVIHVLFFFFLTILIKFAFKEKFTNSKSFWVILLISYAILIEVLQYLMNLGRSFSVLDIMADVIGFSIVIYSSLINYENYDNKWNK